ncbi:MAG: M28 family peptidase [candidate division Zixibacteria bacterium]
MINSKIAALLIILLSVFLSACSDVPVFDGERAYADLVRQCSFGPRVAGTEAHRETGRFLFEELRKTTDICRVQRFTVFDSIAGAEKEMLNIIASYYPDSDRRIMLCAHWDSRPYSNMDPDSGKHELPVPGANDGASGTALLLEIGRLLKDHRPPVGIDIVLFDGEDYGTDEWPGGWFLGSKHFVRNLRGYRPRAAILVDMIGDSDLRIYREAVSELYSKDLNDYIWEIASEVGAGAFEDAVKDTVSDDHIPLIEAGIKAIDIIDFNYPYWHTQEDTPDKCSPESLGDVGRVVIGAVFDERILDF